MSRTHKTAPTKQCGMKNAYPMVAPSQHGGSGDAYPMVHALWLHLLSNVAVRMHTLLCIPYDANPTAALIQQCGSEDAYPMVLTTASTETASTFSVGLLLFPLCLMADCSLVLVSKSRTYTIQTDHILNITTLI